MISGLKIGSNKKDKSPKYSYSGLYTAKRVAWGWATKIRQSPWPCHKNQINGVDETACVSVGFM